MGVIASLDVFLRGNTQQLDTALDKSGKKIEDLKNVANVPSPMGALSGPTANFDKISTRLKDLQNQAGQFKLSGESKGLLAELEKVQGKIQAIKNKADTPAKLEKWAPALKPLEKELDKVQAKLEALNKTKPAGFGALASSMSSAFASFTSGIPGLSPIVGALGNIRAGAQGANSGLGMLAGGFAGLAASVVGAGVGLVGFGLSMQSVIGTTARMAATLGLSTGSLQAMEHQANMSGISAEDLHHNLMKMEEAIADVGSKGHTALAKLGLDMSSLNNKNTLQQWEEIDAAMRKVKNQGDLIANAKAIWGKSGAAMAAMFLEGKKTFAEMKEEAIKLGIVLSKEDVAKVQEGNRAWKEMKAAITGIGMSLAVELAPMVKSVASSIKEMVIGTKQFMGEINVDTPEWMKYIRAIPATFSLGMSTITFGLMKLFEAIVDLLAKIPGIGAGIKVFAEAVNLATKDQFKEMEAKAKTLHDILNPTKKPVVPGAKKTDDEPTKGKSDNESDTKNKAALAGSVEAFSIIAGNDKDKMYRVANATLQENKKLAKAFEKWAQKFAGGVKFFKKKV